MIRRLAVLLATTLFVLPVFGADAVSIEAYSRCTDSLMSAKNLEEAIDACRESAEQGVPGAQFALGGLLMKAARGSASEEATQWLEKAVAQGHTGAAYLLAGTMKDSEETAKKQRVSELFRMAACGDYPAALDELKRAGATKEQLFCGQRADADFNGAWSGSLQWTKVSPGAGSGPELKLVLADGKASVFMKRDDTWSEVKPGKFKVTQLEQTLVVSAIESGSDFDGVWIEAWTIHLLRLDADTAQLSFLRSVNNRDLPATLSWRTFTTAAEGRVQRTTK